MSYTEWKRNLTYTVDPDSKLLYNIDLSDWFPGWNIVSVDLFFNDELISVPYTALDAPAAKFSFKVEDVINNGDRVPVTMRITVTNGVIQQIDDRTINFRARQF